MKELKKGEYKQVNRPVTTETGRKFWVVDREKVYMEDVDGKVFDITKEDTWKTERK